MNSSNRLSYIFRKYSLVRAALILFVIGVAVCIVFITGKNKKAEPVIESLTPSVGSPGDIVVITGKNFGDIRDMSYVEFAGSKLTSSAYISWSDDCIKLVLPANVQDGLVVVGTKDMRSKPALFANEIEIPVPVPAVVQTNKPVISSLSTEKIGVGELLCIYGNNFGDSRGRSSVYFTIDYENKIKDSDYKTKTLLTENMIAASDFNGDYEYWDNSEIWVRVPDGACSGVVIVDTGKEKSEPKDITILRQKGYKEFSSKKIYLVQYTADVSDVITTDVSTITLRCPIPVEMPSQPSVEITEISPEPLLNNYQNCIIHQITKKRNNSPKSVFKQTFVLPVYEIKTSVVPDKIEDYQNMSPSRYASLVKDDEIIPAGDDEIKKLVKTIVGKEKNYYRRAKLIYNYMLDNYKILEKTRKDDASPLDLLKKKSGDAYDFAVICTALFRAAGIPSLIDAGVLIGQDLMTQPHWWTEFYIQGVGWIPVDVALGAGMEYKKWPDVFDERAYYFGNVDSHRIVFSRGIKQLKPFSQDNKIVQYPRTFALQTIWEEASANTAEYSSFWSSSVIKGVY